MKTRSGSFPFYPIYQCWFEIHNPFFGSSATPAYLQKNSG